jgi:hypothetical protein
MYRRSLLTGTSTGQVDGEEDISDRRSSSSSMGWMMKSPLRVTNVEETLPEVTKPSVIDTKPETTVKYVLVTLVINRPRRHC